MDHVYLAVIHRQLLNHWYVLLLGPILTAALGTAFLRKKSVIGVQIVCGVSWLVAFFLVCAVLFVWESAFLPVVRLSD